MRVRRMGLTTRRMVFLLFPCACFDSSPSYVYFEKVRILQNKKKTATRNNNEAMHPSGFPLENRRKYIWARG